jgi:hypothetical protein
MIIANIDISPLLRDAIRSTWYAIRPDAGDCTRLEAAELVIDRLTGEAGKEIEAHIKARGYKAVEHQVAGVL